MKQMIGMGALLAANKSGLPVFPPPGFNTSSTFVMDGGALVMAVQNPNGIGYNTELVKASDVPTSYQDLLNPKWKGKIGAIDPIGAGTFAYEFYNFLLDTYGPSFLSKFAQQDPRFVESGPPGNQALAAGETAIYVPAGSDIPTLAAAGAPVKVVFPKVDEGSGTMALIAAKAPHLAAAKLFLAYLLSKAGNKLFVNGDTVASPYGDPPLPAGFIPQNDAEATNPARVAEIDKLLGISS
jgi:iron(III) transport system substrate-binding protein